MFRVRDASSSRWWHTVRQIFDCVSILLTEILASGLKLRIIYTWQFQIHIDSELRVLLEESEYVEELLHMTLAR